MFKNIMIILSVSVLLAVVSGGILAATDVGNTVCPVTGEKIDAKTKATYEYQGKIYNFCCPMCIDEFKKDPDKYTKKIKEGRGKNAEGQGQPEEEHNK